ncbi:MAG: DUF5916 domain-containing protein [Gemmatimonadota bacterium]
MNVLGTAAVIGGLMMGVASDASASQADTPDPQARALQVATPPTIDGRLDDPVWQQAEPIGDFIQRIPVDGAPASEPTEVRILYDDEALYVGVWLWDSEPSRVVDGPAIRDSRLDDSDAVVMIFDTYHDGQNGFVFGTNPSGIEYDGQVTNEGRGGGFGMGIGGRQQGGAGGGFNLNWDGSWDVSTSRDSRGWYAEFRIPFSTLRYADGADANWGLNVMRRIRRHNEENYWAPVDRQYSLHRVSQAGVLVGLNAPARRQVTLTPYVLQSAQRDFQAGDPGFGYPTEMGADAKVQLTRGLTLDLTLNTDFAQVEVDDQQVNLTRFSLFFPEKRPFFLENAGAFQVGTGGAELFFSRRIGIEGGAPVPIRGGGRLSGRTAGFNVGFLHIQTDHDGPLGPEPATGDAFSVARVARELPNRSQVGTFVAERRGRGLDGDVNRTYALDGQLGLGEALTISSFAARTETPDLDGRDHAFHLSGSYTTREVRGFVTFREVGQDFNPEVGFLSRRDYRMVSTLLMTYHRPERPGLEWLRELRPHVSYNTYRSLETGFEQSARAHVDSHVEFSNGALFSPAFNWVREGLERPFPIAPEVEVQPGTYEGWEAAWRFNTDQSAPLSLDGGIDAGHFLSGSRKGGFGAVSYRHGSEATLSLRVDHNKVDLTEGSFDVTVGSLRAGYFFTPRIYLQSLVQYADQLDTWSANVRFGWLHTAGSGLFVVLNESRGLNTLGGPLNRSVVVKYSRQFEVSGW